MTTRIDLHLDFHSTILPFAPSSGLASWLTLALVPSQQHNTPILLENNPKNNEVHFSQIISWAEFWWQEEDV